MPFYEYECQACKFYTEVMQKISDPPLTRCPSCGKRRLKKLVSAPVFRLKGSGWYETDFKSDKEEKRNLVGADKEEAKPESKADAKDTKPEKDGTPGAKEAKVTDTKAESKTPTPKPAAAKSASSGRRPGKSARARSTRRRRR
jgi:putative FmdB family regulatory protein